MLKETELIVIRNTQGFEKSLTQAIILIHYETCGLCGKRERVNELGEFIFPCPKK